MFFFLFQSETSFTQTKNTIIISVGNYPVTRLDLLKEIKLIAILSNTQINNENQEQIKALAVKSLIKRNIKTGELQRRKSDRYNTKQLNFLIDNTAKKLGVDRNGLKQILEKHNLSYETLIERFKTDLKWNNMIFQIYKNKISLNTTEIENKIQLYLENSKKTNTQINISSIKEKIVGEEREKKLTMFSNLHYSNLKIGIIFSHTIVLFCFLLNLIFHMFYFKLLEFLSYKIT